MTSTAYDGLSMRLAPFARFATVFAWGLRRTLRSRMFVVTMGLALLAGAGLGAIVAREFSPVVAIWHLLGEPLLGIAVPLIALALVGTGFGEEVQEQTLVFHLVRPVSRSTVFFARYAAGLPPAILAATVMVLSAVIASRASLPARVPVLAALVAVLGVVSVGALYYALAAIFRRGLIAGLVYTFIIEGAFQFLPGTIQKLSLMHHVRSVFHRLLDPDFAAQSVRVATTVARRAARASDPQSLVLSAAKRVEWTETSTALLICAIVTVVSLWLSSRAVSRKDFALKD